MLWLVINDVFESAVNQLDPTPLPERGIWPRVQSSSLAYSPAITYPPKVIQNNENAMQLTNDS